MKLHHLRNATFVIEVGDRHILVDPMLGEAGGMPPYARLRHPPRRNPTVPLPPGSEAILERVTHCLITHCQKLGLRSLAHTDHLDRAGETFLRERGIPVVASVNDVTYLRGRGLEVDVALESWSARPALGGEVTAIPARHGHGWIRHLMANGVGYFVSLPGEPSIYVSGDTVYTDDVERALTELAPDIAVMASGSASIDVGRPILMTLDELVRFARRAPGRVIANHLEALNHCPTTRTELRQRLVDEGLAGKVLVPEDGESITLRLEA